MICRQLFVFITIFSLAFSVNAANRLSGKPHHRRVASAQSINQKININTADVAALQSVKGIGPKKAAAIVAYRNTHGKFKFLEDLTNIKGIGGKRLAKIKKQLAI